MIAKIIAWGADRDEALARLRRALADTMVVVDGGTTNQGFLLELLDRPEVRTGEVDTTWLDRLHLDGEIVPMRHADVALLQAAIVLAEEATAADRARFYALARRGRPQADADLVRTVDLRHRGQTYRLAVAQIALGRYRVTVDGESVEVAVHRVGAARAPPRDATARAHRTLTSVQDADLRRRGRRRAAPDRARRRRARAQPRARRRGLDPGRRRRRGPRGRRRRGRRGDEDGELADARRSTVACDRCSSAPTSTFAAQAPLVQLEPLDGGPPPATRRPRRVRAARAAAAGAEGCREQLRRLEWLVLGYDVGAAEAERIVADLHGACADPLDSDPALLTGEHRLLRMFADVRALSRPRHDEADPETPWLRSPQEHLNAWLGSLDAAAEGLPPDFLALLRAALAHYAIDDLDRTPALEEACYRLYLAQERAETARAAVVAILDRRLERAGQLAGQLGRRLPRGARPPRRGHRRARRRRGRPRPRGALPLLRRARHRRRQRARLRARWSSTSPRSPRTPRVRIATSASRRSWPARGRSPPCSPRA